jgi:wyosine [tRNA(Phe)-imidazoG37] synthetase (radical SAM superfamily)
MPDAAGRRNLPVIVDQNSRLKARCSMMRRRGVRLGLSPNQDTAFGCARDFLDHRYVYTVLSSRCGGLAICVNLSPDHRCNLNCRYCEVDRSHPVVAQPVNVELMTRELRDTLDLIERGGLRTRKQYRSAPDDVLRLRQVSLSGDGEPTLAPNFQPAVEAIVHMRALGEYPFFKLVLVTNGTTLHEPAVREAVRHMCRSDEIWIKLDGGTDAYLGRIQDSATPVERVMTNLLELGRTRPVVVQSLFPAIDGEEPSLEEIERFAQRLNSLRASGAQISHVQVCSATPRSRNSQFGHLPLRSLSQIAHTVRRVSGLHADVY